MAILLLKTGLRESKTACDKKIRNKKDACKGVFFILARRQIILPPA